MSTSTFPYKAVSGDDPTKIGAKVNLSGADIMKANPQIKSDNNIQIGDTVNIPIDIITIQTGNTVNGIGGGRIPKVEAKQVAVVNTAGLDLDKIKQGQQINFPRKP